MLISLSPLRYAVNSQIYIMKKLNDKSLWTDFFKDNKGKLSTARLVLVVILLWFISDWLVELIKNGLYDLTWQKLTLICSGLGLKSIQKFKET